MNKSYILLTILVLALLLGACGPKPVDFYNEELLPLLVEFQGQNELATNTPRNQLTSVISQMVTTRSKIQAMASSGNAPECFRSGLSDVLDSSQAVINAAQDWVTFDIEASKKTQNDHDERVAQDWNVATLNLSAAAAKIKADCSLK